MGVVYVNGLPAFVPMDPYEVEAFLYTHGLDAPGAECKIEGCNDYYDNHIEWGTDFRQANRLMQRISDLGDRRESFKAWCGAQERCTVEDALKASYNMWAIDFYPGVNSDELLGQHALDCDIFYEYSELDDDVRAMLDHAKVGERMREQDGGVFASGGYLVAPDFSDEPLPAEAPVPWIEVRFRHGELESGWHEVPKSAHDERVIANILDCDSLDGLDMDCRSLIPRLNDITSGVDELPDLRALDKALNGMNGDEIQKYKALLEVIQPGSIREALRLAGDMDQYDVTLQYADPAVYGLQHAAYCYSLDENSPLMAYINFASYGADMLLEDGFTQTRYGAVHTEDMACDEDMAEEQTENFGGMGGMA